MILAANGTHLKKRAWKLQEISEVTGLSLPYLRMRAGNELKITRFGKAIRVLDEDLSEFLTKGAQSYKTTATDK